jgi:hypothetical protein
MSRSVVFYDPHDPSAGAIAASFEAARRVAPSPGKKAAINSAQRAWHSNAAAVRTPGEITAMALDAAEQMGVLDFMVSGLVEVGVLPPPVRIGGNGAENVQRATQPVEPGYLETGVRVLSEAGTGAKEVALRAGAGAERLATTYMQEAGKTIRTGPFGETAQKVAEEGGETAQKVAEEAGEAAGEITAGQVVLVLGGLGIAGLLIYSLATGEKKRPKAQATAA